MANDARAAARAANEKALRQLDAVHQTKQRAARKDPGADTSREIAERVKSGNWQLPEPGPRT